MGNKFHRLNSLKNKTVLLTKSFVQKSKSIFDKLVSKGFTKKQTIIISSLLILCLVVLLIPTKKIETPNASISKIETAIFNADTKTISSLININNISKSIATAVLSEVESKKLTADLLSYMQTELENKITADFFSIVEKKGDFYQNINNPNAVLSKTINFLIGKSGSVTKREVTYLDEKKSVIELTVFRPSLNKEIKVNLIFKHNDYNWVLNDIEDIKGLLKNLEEIEHDRVSKLNLDVQEQINKTLILKDFQKSDINLEENSFLMRLSLENISNEDLKEVHGKLKMMNQDQLIGSIDIKINETIFANNFYEKAWSIKLNDYESLKNIVKTSKANLNATFEIEKVIFAEGNVLQIIK